LSASRWQRVDRCRGRFVDANSSSCPFDAIAVEPGNSIQAAVDFAGDGAVFCLKKGIHRAQAVRPRAGQLFYGEGETVLNGSRLLDGFRREGRYWVANSQLQRVPKHGACLPKRPPATGTKRCSLTTNRSKC
jgi:hypothetical protein